MTGRDRIALAACSRGGSPTAGDGGSVVLDAREGAGLMARASGGEPPALCCVCTSNRGVSVCVLRGSS